MGESRAIVENPQGISINRIHHRIIVPTSRNVRGDPARERMPGSMMGLNQSEIPALTNMAVRLMTIAKKLMISQFTPVEISGILMMPKMIRAAKAIRAATVVLMPVNFSVEKRISARIRMVAQMIS